MQRTFNSIGEFEKHYFPKAYAEAYEKNLFENGSPKEIADYLIEKAFEKIEVRNSQKQNRK